MPSGFRLRGGFSTLRSTNTDIRGNGSFTQTVTGTLGGLAGACTTAATFLSSCAGTLGGWVGTLTTLFIAGPASGIHILQRLRRRGDL